MAPASTVGNDGLGPLFNARSCSACHAKDGRGKPPEQPSEAMVSLLLRLSVPGLDEHGGPLGDPVYGTQLQPLAILGIPAEGKPLVTYQETTGVFEDGEVYSLRQPSYSIEQLGYGSLATGLLISPRVGQFVFGLGLLETVTEATLLAHADENDSNGDGVSGRPNYVWNSALNAAALGRFGWKANVSTVFQQTAGAFLGDLGISSRVFPQHECSSAQTACLAAPRGDDEPEGHEINDQKLQAVADYMMLLAVPARRNVEDANVQRGENIFSSIGCAQCHRSTLQTGINEKFSELSNQTIYPYTDMLLHDMGPALADQRPDFMAQGSEWRTAPLWGIGLVKTVNGHTNFLHDGRARSLLEAILWHEGEAVSARDNVRRLPLVDRNALLSFLESL